MEKERFVTSFDGTQLFTSTVGEGMPLLLSDGLGCDGFIWCYLKPQLQDRFQVIHWHYRGHGQSGKPKDYDALGVPALRADMLAVLDAYGVDKAILFGHSMGVQVVLDFALQHEERVAGLVPICGSYGRPLDTFHGDGRLAAMFPIMRDLVTRWPKPGQAVWRHLLMSKLAVRYAMLAEVNGRILRERDFAPYFEHLAGMDVQVFMRLLERLQSHTVEDRLTDLRTPTLVVAGERDTFTPVWLSHRMQMLIPDAEMLIVPGGTHVAPLEIPELLALRLERFFAERIQPALKKSSAAQTDPSKSASTRPRRKRASRKRVREAPEPAAKSEAGSPP